MSVAIDTVTIGSVEDRRMVLSNSQAARIIDIGTSWNRIRLGVRWSFDDSGANIISTPRLYLGMLSSPSAALANGPLGATTSHFVGFIQNAATVLRQTGPPVWYTNFGSTTCYAKKIGSTITTATGPTTNLAIPASPSVRRGPFLVEILKGSPNFTITLCAGTLNPADLPNVNDLKAVVELSTMAGAATYLQTLIGGSFSAGFTANLAVDEATNGFLNAVCIAWDRSNPAVHISDFYWAKMA